MVILKNNNIPVSIIIRTNNSEHVIGETLTSLFMQAYEKYELIVIDYSSTDRTRDIVREYNCIRYKVNSNTYSTGHVLNNTISTTNGDMIVFLNADAPLVSPYALKRLVGSFDNPAVKAAFGRQVPRIDAESWIRPCYQKAFPEKGVAPDYIPFSMSFAAIRRSIWQERPFSIDAWGAEDFEWGCWAKRKGYLIQYVSDAVVMHSHTYAANQFNDYSFIEGDADAFLCLHKYKMLSIDKSEDVDNIEGDYAMPLSGIILPSSQSVLFNQQNHSGNSKKLTPNKTRVNAKNINPAEYINYLSIN